MEGEECVYCREAGDEAEPTPPLSRGGDREREGLDASKLCLWVHKPASGKSRRVALKVFVLFFEI